MVLASTSQSTDSVLLEKHGQISTRPLTHADVLLHPVATLTLITALAPEQLS